MKFRSFFAALAALLLAMTLTAAATATESTDKVTRISTEKAEAEAEASSDGIRTAQATRTASGSSKDCFEDGRNDVINGFTGEYEAYPKADLVAWCAEYNGSDIVLRHRNATPTNPSSDTNWREGFSGLLWDVSTNGGFTPGEMQEFGVYYFHDGSSIVAIVERRSDESIVCEAIPSFDGTYYLAQFPASCIGNPPTINTDAFMSYDSNARDENAPVYLDLADYAAGVERPAPGGGQNPNPAPNPEPNQPQQSRYFRDVQGFHAPNVDFLYEQGLINGCGDNTFCPGNSLTRAQFATIMAEYIRSTQ